MAYLSRVFMFKLFSRSQVYRESRVRVQYSCARLSTWNGGIRDARDRFTRPLEVNDDAILMPGNSCVECSA